ncbi:MAG: transposase [Spirochaetes bacterium]|nr:transposase [Spirochaetota bacterium]MBN2770102.1 transposase [Spirochaetota bacterium]
MSNNQKYRRRSIRLKGYDYTRPGYYYITICTYNRECIFGKIVNKKMILNQYGQIACDCWSQIPVHFETVKLHAFVIMPNHLHGILEIKTHSAPVGSRHAVTQPGRTEQFGKPVPGSIPTIIRGYKSAVTNRINDVRSRHAVPSQPCKSVWQRNYYEHIIRDDKSFWIISRYIKNNPANY